MPTKAEKYVDLLGKAAECKPHFVIDPSRAATVSKLGNLQIGHDIYMDREIVVAFVEWLTETFIVE